MSVSNSYLEYILMNSRRIFSDEGAEVTVLWIRCPRLFAANRISPSALGQPAERL